MLKKGLNVNNAHLTLFYRLPYNDPNPEVTANGAGNARSTTERKQG